MACATASSAKVWFHSRGARFGVTTVGFSRSCRAEMTPQGGVAVGLAERHGAQLVHDEAGRALVRLERVVQALGRLRRAQVVHHCGQGGVEHPVAPLALGVPERPGQVRLPQAAPPDEQRPDPLGHEVRGEEVQVPTPELPGGHGGPRSRRGLRSAPRRTWPPGSAPPPAARGGGRARGPPGPRAPRAPPCARRGAARPRPPGTAGRSGTGAGSVSAQASASPGGSSGGAGSRSPSQSKAS